MQRHLEQKKFKKPPNESPIQKSIEDAEIVGEGTLRDAHQFRASPDLLKTLSTGTGAVLVVHGKSMPNGATIVFKIRFPRLGEECTSN